MYINYICNICIYDGAAPKGKTLNMHYGIGNRWHMDWTRYIQYIYIHITCIAAISHNSNKEHAMHIWCKYSGTIEG